MRHASPASEQPPQHPSSIPWAPARASPPSLTNLCLEVLARDSSILSTDCLDAIDEPLAVALLRQIMQRKRPNTATAKKFIASRHSELSDALSHLDLVAGVDSYGPGFAPRGGARSPR